MISKKDLFIKHKFKCSCGRVHELPIKEIIVDNNAIEGIKNIREKYNLGKNGLVIIDQNIKKIIGKQILDLLFSGGCNIKESVFNLNNLIADEKAITKILNDIDKNTGFLIAVGSGTINDLTRYISFKTRRPYISIPTSPSMDGYTANVSLLVNNGYKKTFKAESPLAIYADIKLLRNAPLNSIKAGFGDLIAKYTACADWLLSSIINNEYYCEFTHNTILEYVNRCFENIRNINFINEKDILILVEGLMVSGITMHWVKSSRPVAGAEHHISHFWEMKDMQLGNPGHLHGLKVGFGTLVMSMIYEELLSINFCKDEKNKRIPSKDEWEANIKKIFKDVSKEIIMENQDRFFSEEYWEKQRKSIIKKSNIWKTKIRAILPESKKIERWIFKINGIISPKQLGLTVGTLKESIIYCKELRKKFTVLEVLEYIGLLSDIAGKVSRKLCCNGHRKST